MHPNKKTVIYFRDELPPCQRPLEAVKCPVESGDFGLGACFPPAWRGTGLCLSALYPCCNVLPPRMTVCAVRRAPGQYLLRSLPPVGRHLETLPDVTANC